MMHSQRQGINRTQRLNQFMSQVNRGDQTVQNGSNARLYIEAVCSQADRIKCVDQLIGSPKGKAALKSALQIDVSIAFLQGSFKDLIRYLSSPEIKPINSGQFLQQLLLAITDPPIIWREALNALKNGLLDEDTKEQVAWLLLELVSLASDISKPHIDAAKDPVVLKTFESSSKTETRLLGHKIKHVIETIANPTLEGIAGPGGRHDNDNKDFRLINILPSRDEIYSKDEPFLRTAIDVSACEEQDRFAVHLDNQFRLNREDMVRDIREDLQILAGSKQGKRRGYLIDQLSIKGIKCDEDKPWVLELECVRDIPQLQKLSGQKRSDWIINHKDFLKHESVACVMSHGQVIGFFTIRRDEASLAKKPPTVSLAVDGDQKSFVKTIIEIKDKGEVQLLQINTAIFAYKPVLQQLQAIKQLPLRDEIMLNPSATNTWTKFLQRLPITAKSPDFARKLRLLDPVKLDDAQAECFDAAVSQRLSVILGPPGTGKSFLGALIVKAYYRKTEEAILVICYTNHAIDQFLLDMKTIGIEADDIVRLGAASKSSTQIQDVLLSNQKKKSPLSWAQRELLDQSGQNLNSARAQLRSAFAKLQKNRVQQEQIMEYLEFEEPALYEALCLPNSTDEMQVVGKGGKKIGEHYLLDRWTRGQDAGVLARQATLFPEPWSMSPKDRTSTVTKIKHAIITEQAEDVARHGIQFQSALEDRQRIFAERDRCVIRSKRIICCTTTGAAKYAHLIQHANPGIVLVEEAGEVLESHILTALGPSTEKLILIGDHKQLRPKVNYNLSVEKGAGYDLNMSMLERLVVNGHSHQVLKQQHRMRPEISALVRELTYPDLTDAPKTKGRPDIRGLQSNIAFVNHNVPEESHKAPEWRDQNSPQTRQNRFEANMVLKCVRYLAQQGYGSDQIVVLTPYLGQLRLLYDVLREENDPVLNDLDSYDLVRAGLLPQVAADVQKKRLRVSTIDNYQGEESDIVVISLTRSNENNDIGFMSQPERVNVLLSRARDGLILIGNAMTFSGNKKSRETWTKVIKQLKDSGYLFDGLPVKCERHPERKVLITSPNDFDTLSPDGGCLEPCGKMLKCGSHKCPLKCHQLDDHSKMPCKFLMKKSCDIGHAQTWTCDKREPKSCPKCERQRLIQEKLAREALDRQIKADEAQKRHDAEMLVLNQQLQSLRDASALEKENQDRVAAIENKKREIQQVKDLRASATNVSVKYPPEQTPKNVAAPAATSVQNAKSPIDSPAKPMAQSQNDPGITVPTNGKPLDGKDPNESPAEKKWSRQKRVEGASNDFLDTLMKMTGLENVKMRMLDIKSRIETAQRQGSDLKKERLGTVLLGNPGTGKTTVARLYASLLASLGALPDTVFVETTGSNLANSGVTGAKEIIKQLSTGGACFVDEAYQLVSGDNFGGTAVLDYLLAEMENKTGTIIFLFAGYTKQMEKFFEHNPGIASRLPYTLQFEDYTDKELQVMFQRSIDSRFHGRMKIENGFDGLYVRVMIRRLGRGRGREGFGNARALENLISKVLDRQCARLDQQRASRQVPDDFLLTKEDLIGPEPGKSLANCPAWNQLRQMIGLKSVKESVQALLDKLQTNYRRELAEKSPVEICLNRALIGSPGTGKTTVAKLYGQVLKAIGVLSNGECDVKNPSDFIGSVVGESEKKTKNILKTTEGKVLVIDEAYMLHSSSGSKPSGGAGATDPYRSGVIDTLVAEVQSVPGEDRCVLLLGYKDKIEEWFKDSNPGLARRFPLEDAFVFEDFDNAQLRQILDLKLKQQEVTATKEAKDVVIEILDRARRRKNFGNAGEIENLLSRAKTSHQKRMSQKPIAQRPVDIILEPYDFDEKYDRMRSSIPNIRNSFSDVIGNENLISKLESYARTAINLKARGKSPENHIPFNYIFSGPPGTGKTTTARKMGQAFYDMGFLDSPEVYECSASDLIAGYVGQTALKTVEKLESALGRVLFIDEAYRLSEGPFALEAINQLVDSLTKPQFQGKMIVILAGYKDQMNDLLATNPGLSSRFSEEIAFENLTAAHCFELMERTLSKDDINIGPDDHTCKREIIGIFQNMCALPGWGNGRDVKEISKSIVKDVLQSDTDPEAELRVTYPQIKRTMLRSLTQRRLRARTTKVSKAVENLNIPLATDLANMNPPKMNTSHEQSTNKPQASSAEPKDDSKSQQSPKGDDPTPPASLREENHSGVASRQSPGRDAGVSDDVWAQLLADMARNHQEDLALENVIRETKAKVRRTSLQLDKSRQIWEELKHKTEEATDKGNSNNTKAKQAAESKVNNDKANEIRRKQEVARLVYLRAKRAKEEAEERARKAMEAEQKRKQQEQKAQQKLRSMGVCPAGFLWIKQHGGYRCGGGSHFVSDAALQRYN